MVNIKALAYSSLGFLQIVTITVETGLQILTLMTQFAEGESWLRSRAKIKQPPPLKG